MIQYPRISHGWKLSAVIVICSKRREPCTCREGLMRCKPDRKEARGEDRFRAKFMACSSLRWSELAMSIHLDEVRPYPARMREAIIDAWHKHCYSTRAATEGLRPLAQLHGGQGRHHKRALHIARCCKRCRARDGGSRRERGDRVPRRSPASRCSPGGRRVAVMRGVRTRA